MLKKLMKHDFRALSRTLFPLQIGVLGGGLVATLLTALTIRLGENASGTGGSALLRQLIMGVSATASVLIGIAIMASALVTLLLICYHFYRSFLGDEGYLTFTLPVPTSKLIWSKLLTGMFWTLINSLLLRAMTRHVSRRFLGMGSISEISPSTSSSKSSKSLSFTLPSTCFWEMLSSLAGTRPGLCAIN